jgi:serine/threonine protein kinase
MNQIIREINNLRRLNHTNILKFYECYVIDDDLFVMVTEYCSEGSLN